MARNIVLKSSDGVVFEVDELAAVQSKLIEFMIEAENGILLPKVTSAILSKVIEYCKKHADAAAADEDLRSWDAEFVSTVDQATLFDLILAANYMENEGLLRLTCHAVADQIKGKTPEEIRRTFNIKTNFTPEEEEEVRRENAWAFE